MSLRILSRTGLPVGCSVGLLLIRWSSVDFLASRIGFTSISSTGPSPKNLLAKRLECLCSLHSSPTLGLFYDYEGLWRNWMKVILKSSCCCLGAALEHDCTHCLSQRMPSKHEPENKRHIQAMPGAFRARWGGGSTPWHPDEHSNWQKSRVIGGGVHLPNVTVIWWYLVLINMYCWPV